MIAVFRRRYGAGPLHLLAMLAGFAVAGCWLAVAEILFLASAALYAWRVRRTTRPAALAVASRDRTA